MYGLSPWTSDAIKLLEQEIIHIVKQIDTNNTALREPFVIDLVPKHLDDHRADATEREFFDRVMSTFRRRWREFTTPRQSLIESPRTSIVPYVVVDGQGPDEGAWQDVVPQYDKHDG